jgi:hypothetical protein
VLLVAGAVKAAVGIVHFRCSTRGGQRAARRSLVVLVALQSAFAVFWVLAFAGLLPGTDAAELGLWFVPASSIAILGIALRGLRNEERAR